MLLILLTAVALFELYPFGVLRVKRCPKREKKGSTTHGEDFVVHLHTVFSYDSLGKPEEAEYFASLLGVKKVFITDHDREDLDRYLPPSPVLVPGYEYQDKEFGRLLKLAMGRFTVIAHPNNEKKELYRWRGNFKKDFYYELIDLKDVLYAAPLPLKFYLVLRTIFLFPFRGLKGLDYFPRLIPLRRWIETYIERTRGTLRIIGGLDHHVKLSFWEKPHRSFSFPHYLWSFYLLRNRTLGETDIFKALEGGTFYISLCGGSLHFEKGKLLLGKRELLFLHYANGKVEVSNCGRIDKRAPVGVVYKYKFRFGNLYFGLTPLAVFRTDIFPSGEND